MTTFKCTACNGTGERHKQVNNKLRRFSCVPCGGTGQWIIVRPKKLTQVDGNFLDWKESRGNL